MRVVLACSRKGYIRSNHIIYLKAISYRLQWCFWYSPPTTRRLTRVWSAMYWNFLFLWCPRTLRLILSSSYFCIKVNTVSHLQALNDTENPRQFHRWSRLYVCLTVLKKEASFLHCLKRRYIIYCCRKGGKAKLVVWDITIISNIFYHQGTD